MRISYESLELKEGLNPEQLAVCRKALEECWIRYAPTPSQSELLLNFADLAWSVELWWMVRKALVYSLETTDSSNNIWLWLAACESQCGRQDEAISCLMQSLEIDCKNPSTSELILDISPRWARQHELTAVARCGQTMRLEPMGFHHAHALLWQYRDPQIAAWASSNPMPNLDSVHAWIAEEAMRAGKRSLAVMHVDDGFVGEVGYIGNGETAFVHFWIGCDHQGKGYAAPAVTMMCAQAESDGIRLLFTACHSDNLRSQRVLARNGFTEMVMPPLEKEDKNLKFFVRKSADSSSENVFDQLDALLSYLGCPLNLAVRA